jgi:aminoglycoside 3-N-acetyltransferase
MFTRSTLAAHFRALGVAPGDVVMLHASVRAVGEIAGGPDQIHLALADLLTPAGTIVMYAGCPRYVDEVGRGDLSLEQEAEVLEKLPPFDAATARSARDHGILVEFLRTWPGTRACDHVTRFIARGSQAELLCAPPPWDDALGRGSALDCLVALDGRILLLGSDHDAVTFLHYVEHVADFPDKRIARFRVPVLDAGQRVWRWMAEVDSSSSGAHAHWPDRFFARLVDAHLAASGNDGGRVGDAQSYLISARDLLAFARAWMERIAANAAAVAELDRCARP